LQVFTAEERPDLWIRAKALSGVWPEYNNHGNHTGSYFGSLIPRYAHFQVVIYDPECDEVVARGRSIPFRWEGTLADLPGGMDAAGLRALEVGSTPNTLSALAAEVADGVRGRGVSHLVIEALATVARRSGLGSLVAPVRPSWKDRYPLIPIDRYAGWKRDDGLPFDPWMRVHTRLGATILRPEPNSLMISASVSDWELWTDMTFPADGDYTFPYGLAPLHVAGGTGLYWEPDVWMLHTL
jgi:GNAT superfamily N-acetyltransferase